MSIYYTDKHVSEKSKMLMASMAMTALFLSEGIAYASFDPTIEMEKSAIEKINSNSTINKMGPLIDLENKLVQDRNATIKGKGFYINPSEVNEDELIDLKEALDKEYEKGFKAGYEEGYKNGLLKKNKKVKVPSHD